MTQRKDVHVTILCEDIRTGHFARAYLDLRGFNPRKIRFKFSPKGKGAGEQFVREQLPNQLKAQRSNGYESRLLVITDADNKTVRERCNQLDGEIQTQGVSPIRSDESVAVFVPKWSIESWLLYGVGENFQEDRTDKNSWENYQRKHGVKHREVAQKYHNEICQPPLPADAPSSLHHACDELAKIL